MVRHGDGGSDCFISDIRNFRKQWRKAPVGFIDNFLVLGGQVPGGGALRDVWLFDSDFQPGEKRLQKPADCFGRLLQGGSSNGETHEWIGELEGAYVHQLFVPESACHQGGGCGVYRSLNKSLMQCEHPPDARNKELSNRAVSSCTA